MTPTPLARIREAVIAGAIGGVGAGLVFAALHAFIIVPIWDRMMGGLVFGALAGAVAGWAFSELYPEQPDVKSSMAAGAKYGALLWLAVTPVSVADAILRAIGFLPRYELVGVAVAVIIAVAMGARWGWSRTRRKRGMVACAAATLALTVAMAGPVPIGRNIWAFGIFLAVFPASIVAGTILGASVALGRRHTEAIAP
jgi:hypothetical protein